MAERQRIDREIQSVQRGGVKALPDDRALERIREIIALADELTGDFRRVRDEFDKLNRHLRESLMKTKETEVMCSCPLCRCRPDWRERCRKDLRGFWRLLSTLKQSAALEPP